MESSKRPKNDSFHKKVTAEKIPVVYASMKKTVVLHPIKDGYVRTLLAILIEEMERNVLDRAELHNS